MADIEDRQLELVAHALDHAHDLVRARLIERGITRLPDSHFKCDGWFDLGLAQMIIGGYERAKRAYTAALARAWEADDRATIYRNRGKARMLAGRLTDAVRRR